jgi:hypothetical protein
MADDEPTNTDSFSFKDIALLVPVLGSGMAMTYDSGYFWGLDIKMFTMFSFSEHVVFALEALPVAMLASLILAAFVIFGELGAQSGSRVTNSEKLFSDNTTKVIKLIELHVIYLVFIGLGAFEVAATNYAFGVAMLLLGVWSALKLYVPALTNRTIVLQVVACFGLLLVSFAAGFELQNDDARRTTPSHLIKVGDKDLSGLVIRSGDKGLLFCQLKPKQLMFVKWDQVSSVSAVPKPEVTSPSAPPVSPTVVPAPVPKPAAPAN